MYRTGEGIINTENVADLLYSGDHLGIDWLVQACIKFLLSNIDKDNVGYIAVELADRFRLPDLLRACLIFAFKNRNDISPKILAQIQQLSRNTRKYRN